MSTDVRGQVPGDAERPVTPDAVTRGDAARRRLRFRRAVAVRSIAHLAAWTPFLYALSRAIHDGWKPVSDTAVIALRSWDALSTHGLLVGEATRLAHGVYDLGPLEFWLLTLPVHLDPVQGVLWGGALWCMVAASLAIEAASAAVGQLGAVLASGMIVGIVAWIPKIAMLPDWNPWFGMMFFLAALASGWAVLSGYQKWWPALAVTGSVAAQAHLMYAVAAAGLLLLGFIVVVAESLRSGKYGWAVAGGAVGLACWAAPLIQQVTARTGNMTLLIHAVRAEHTAHAGLVYGLKALSAATQPPTYWWTFPLPALKLDAIDQRAAWFGVVELGIMALMLIVAIFVLRSRRSAALATLSLLTSAAALETYSGIPASNLHREPTDLSYLMAPMFPMGVLAWLAAACVLFLAARRVRPWLRTHVATRQSVGERSRAAGMVRTPWGLRVTGFTAVALMVGLAAGALVHIGGASRKQNLSRKVITSASITIERDISAQRIALVVIAPNGNDLRQVTMGLAYSLRTAGYTPEISTWAFQIGQEYAYKNDRIARAKVFIHNHGIPARVIITGGHP